MSSEDLEASLSTEQKEALDRYFPKGNVIGRESYASRGRCITREGMANMILYNVELEKRIKILESLVFESLVFGVDR